MINEPSLAKKYSAFDSRQQIRILYRNKIWRCENKNGNKLRYTQHRAKVHKRNEYEQPNEWEQTDFECFQPQNEMSWYFQFVQSTEVEMPTDHIQCIPLRNNSVPFPISSPFFFFWRMNCSPNLDWNICKVIYTKSFDELSISTG